MDGMLGKKIGMTQVFTADGDTVQVTVVEVGPCVVVAEVEEEVLLHPAEVVRLK